MNLVQLIDCKDDERQEDEIDINEKILFVLTDIYESIELLRAEVREKKS